jgi:diguanylate cyclase
LIDLLLAVVSAALGAAGACWLLSGRRGAAAEDRQRAREVLARLHEVAVRVAADVGQHNSRVEEINGELSAIDGREGDAVLGAVNRIIAANEHMQQQLAKADERLREQARAIESHATEARTDALTMLPNRRAFDDEMARLVREFQQGAGQFSVAMIDIDHFKRVNDDFGHQAGDAILRGVAQTLQTSLGGKGTVARFGGEEFAILLPRQALAEAEAVAERLRQAIAESEFQHDKAALKVTVSVGLTEAIGGDDGAKILERADSALYASKNAARNCSHRHNGRSVEAVPKPTASPTPPSPQVPPATPGGLTSVGQFRIELSRRLEAWRRGGRRPTVVLVQIDHQERLVAEYGEPAYRFALHATQRLLQAAIRPTDPVAPYAEATFVMLLPGIGTSTGLTLVERLRKAISQCTAPISGQHVRFSVSVGMAEADRGEAVESLLERAVAALEAAAQPGGNRTYIHNGQWAETADAALARCRSVEPASV